MNSTGQQAPSNLTATYTSNGIYQLTYNVTLSNLYVVQVKINGTNITNAFAVIVEPGVPYGPTSIANGPGLSQAVTTKPANFTVQTMDRWNNTVTHGGAQFVIAIKDNVDGATSTPTIDDLNNGAYSVGYILSQSGDYFVQVQLNGLGIAGSPFFVKCSWVGLPTGVIVVIGVAGVIVVVALLIGLWVYNKKFRKRGQYKPLRDR